MQSTATSSVEIAHQAVKKAFEDPNIFEDALHGQDFSSLDTAHWWELIAEVWMEAGQPEIGKSEGEILSECRRLYKAKRKEIKARVQELKSQIKDEMYQG